MDDLTENHRDFRFQSADGVDENSPSYSSTNLEFDFETTYNVDAGDFILTEHDIGYLNSLKQEL